MKKIFILIAMFMVCAMSYAQITISSGGSSKSEDYIIKNSYFNVKDAHGVYYLNINDNETTEFIRIPLGQSKEEAAASLSTLYNWFNGAATKDYIEFDADGEIITMYKYSSTIPYFSNGDVEYIKNWVKMATMRGVFGTPMKKGNGKMIGCMMSINQLRTAIDNLN